MRIGTGKSRSVYQLPIWFRCLETMWFRYAHLFKANRCKYVPYRVAISHLSSTRRMYYV